jgi:hypothetical protein
MKEAAALLQLSEMRGLEYIPTKDGFVFSSAEIHSAIDRDQRLGRASTTDFSKFSPDNSKHKPPDRPFTGPQLECNPGPSRKNHVEKS